MYQMHKTLCAVAVSMLGIGDVSYAGETETDSGYWTTTSATVALKKNWNAGLAVQTRARDDFGRLERVVLRPSLSYRLSEITWLTLGYDAHFIRIASDTVEQRTWQQVQSIWPLMGLSFSTRLRLEERFLETADETAFRLRFRLRMDVPIENTDWKATLSNEYFTGLNDSKSGPRAGFDQNRAYAGVSRPISENLSLSLGYQSQYIDRTGTNDLLVHQAMFGLSAKLN